MAQWNWDFAFDWDSAEYPESSGKHYLMHGVVDENQLHANKKPSVTPDLRPPGAPFDLLPGDTMTFTIYNVTRKPGTGYAINKVLMRFFDAMNAAPFALLEAGSVIEWDNLAPTLPDAESAIFSVSRSGTNHPKLPRYSVEDANLYKVKSSTPLGTRVLFDVEVRVTKNGIQKIFYVDPEMVVGGMGAYMAANAKRFAP